MEVGTSKKRGRKGSTISLKGCGTSVALATGPDVEEEELNEFQAWKMKTVTLIHLVCKVAV